MRILQLTAHFSPNLGGVETHLDDLVAGLIKRKYLVTVLTYNPLSADIKTPFIEQDTNLMIYRLPWIRGFFYKLVSSPILEFIYLFPGLFFVAPFIIFNSKIEVIHAHGVVAGTVGVFWGKLTGKRVVISTHSLYNFPKKGLYPFFVKQVFSNADKILCLSKKSVLEFIQLGLPDEKISQFTYWIDFKNFYKKDQLKQKKKFGLEKYFTVLFVGRLVPEKGVMLLIKALEDISGKIRLVVAGDGPLRNKIVSIAQNRDQIKYVGKLNNDELVDYYNAADLLVIPSIHDEGFGRVIIESLACGTAVLGSNRGSIPEVVNDKVARLIDISVKSLKKEIAYLKRNPNVLKKLEINSRRFAVSKYSEKNINSIIKSYD